MRIAQVVAPWLSVPPAGYGGTEGVVHDLTEELVRRGHDVTLFATGDSRTAAKLSWVYEKALGNDGRLTTDPFTLLSQIHPVFTHASAFDIIHVHGIRQALFFSDLVATPVVHTLHSTITQGDASFEKYAIYKSFPKQNYVSISNSQRKGIPELNYVGTVYNGIDLSEFIVGDGSGGYLAWFGRITPKKGVLEAIAVAKKLRIPLKISAYIDPVDRQFFDRDVKPELADPAIEFVGEMPRDRRSEFLGKAKVLLMPIKWHEPFGLVVVETMACGTPVIAFDRGSMQELINPGKNGFIVSPGSVLNLTAVDTAGVDAMATAVTTLMALPDEIYQTMRRNCRDHIESSFTVSRMVDGYEKVYNSLVAKK